MEKVRILWEGFKLGGKGALVKTFDLCIDSLCSYGKKFSALLHPIKKKLSTLLPHVALLILMLLIGSSVFWMFPSQNQPFHVFQSSIKQGAITQSRLLFSDGIKVHLEKDNSKIAFTADQQIVIKVLGTKHIFSVCLAEQSIATIFLEGEVSINKRASLEFMADITPGKLDLKSIEHVMAALPDISSKQYKIKDKEILIEEKMDIIKMRK